MAQHFISPKVAFACDCCGAKSELSYETGKKPPDRPAEWIEIVAIGQKVSYPGEPMRKLLCAGCGELTLQAIERVEPKTTVKS